jgi:hypothetical protein
LSGPLLIVGVAPFSLSLNTGIHSIRKGFRPAVFYTLAWSCLLLGNLAMTLMFNGMLPLSPLVQWSSFIGGALEVSLMSLALGARVTDSRMRSENKIRDLNQILSKHLEEVEAVVAERTATIRSIVDHVKSGFFTVNRQLQIEAGFTKSCYRLLGKNMQAEVQVADVLELEGSRRSMFQMAIQQAFEDNLTEVAALSQIPKSFRIGHTVLSLEGALIRDGAGRPKTILFTVNDMTKLRLKQREALKSSMLIKILRNMSSFTSFLAVTRDKIKLLRTEELRANHKMVAFMLHTIKGNCSIFKRSFPENLIFRAGIHCRSWNADSKPMSAAPLSRGWAQDKSTLALTQPMAREKVLIGFQRYAEVGPRNPSNTAGPRLLESECLDHQPADTIPVDESQCRKCLKQIEAQAFWESSV